MKIQISSRQLIDYFNQLDSHEDYLMINCKKYNTKQYSDDSGEDKSYHISFGAIPKEKEHLGYEQILCHKDITKRFIRVCGIDFYFRKYKDHNRETKYVNDLKITMELDKNACEVLTN